MPRTPARSLGLVLAFTLVAGLAAFAFTAANTVPDSFAGDGAEAISGYTVSDVTYTVGGTNDDEITQVGFTLASASTADYVAPEGALEIKLRSDGIWHTCALDEVDDTLATCATTGETVEDATELRVIAVQ